jgi:CRP-like cAMP-binding protein
VGRALAGHASAGALSPEQRTNLSVEFALEEHEAGVTVQAAGEPQRLGVVVKGSLKAGEESLEPGAVFGAGALSSAPAEAALETAGPARLLLLPLESLETFLRAHPATADALAKAGEA